MALRIIQIALCLASPLTWVEQSRAGSAVVHHDNFDEQKATIVQVTSKVAGIISAVGRDSMKVLCFEHRLFI